MPKKPEFLSDIYHACQLGDLNAVKSYIQTEQLPPGYDNDTLKRTPLFVAAENGQLEIVEFLYSQCDSFNGSFRTWPPEYYQFLVG